LKWLVHGIVLPTNKHGDDPRKNWMGSEMIFVEAKTTMFGLHVDFESVKKKT